MRKFKIYRAGIIAALLLYSAALFLPAVDISFRQIIVVLALFMFLFVYIFLFSVLNYFKEPAWKKLAVILLLFGQYIPYVFIIMKYITLQSYYIIVFILKIPYVIAFITLQNKEIKNLAQSQAYAMLLISAMHLVIFITKFNILNYVVVYDFVVLVPTVLALIMCQKMIAISSKTNEPEEAVTEQIDLLS